MYSHSRTRWPFERAALQHILAVAFSALLLVTLVSCPAAAESVVVRADSVIGEIPAIHGFNGGPLSRIDTWQPPCPNWNAHDLTEQYVELGVPEARTHDLGPFDLDDLWVPWPEFAGHDPSDPANYDWTNSDEYAAAVYSTGVTKIYAYISYSAHHDHCTPPNGYPVEAFGEPPDDFEVFAEVVKHTLMRYTEGWGDSDGDGHDDGFYYDIDALEIFNEPNVDGWWNGTKQEFHDVYVTTRAAIHEHFGDSITCVLYLPPTAWGIELLSYFDPATEPIDAVAIHNYKLMPVQQHSPVWYGAESLETILPAAGYDPAQIPVYVSEWNRTTGKWQDVVPNAAFTAAALYHFAMLHPSNINPLTGRSHNVVMTHFYSSEFQAFFDDGRLKAPGAGIAAYARMANDTPALLEVAEGSGSWHADTYGTNFTVLPGRSADAGTVQVLISDYTNSEEYPWPKEPGAAFDLSLTVNDLPWGDAEFTWKRWRYDTLHELRLAESGTTSGSTSWTWSGQGTRSTFEIFELAATDWPPADDDTGEDTSDPPTGDNPSTGRGCTAAVSGSPLAVLLVLLTLCMWPLRRRCYGDRNDG